MQVQTKELILNIDIIKKTNHLQNTGWRFTAKNRTNEKLNKKYLIYNHSGSLSNFLEMIKIFFK